ncbi:MAG: cytochrome c biogenesis protein [Candidatus Polarisedimenticolia bacterium]
MNGLFWQRILLAVTTLAIAVCITVVFAVVPGERTMGAVQRIFYFHVPSAINAFLGVALCALFSLLYLWRRERRFDILAHGSAELAVLFCSIVLITGPLWARPVWGVWWTGEVRLTSTLVLWLILVGYLVLRASAENPDQAARWGAVVAILGALDVPIIYKSVEWWRGLHPKVLRVSGGRGLDPAMRQALLLCIVSFVLLFALLLVLRTRLGRLQVDVESLTHASRRAPQASAGGGTPS